ncbi:hypothetical protein Tsubulata_040729, partial [Turnera subulata]
MKAYSMALAVLALLLSLVLSAWINRAQAEGRPVKSPASFKTSTSQHATMDLRADKKNPFKKVESSFRRIPPSTSNPTQNKEEQLTLENNIKYLYTIKQPSSSHFYLLG